MGGGGIGKFRGGCVANSVAILTFTLETISIDRKRFLHFRFGVRIKTN